MQIKIRYDNHFQTVEVTEQECANMIRADYEERLAAAADPSTVQPRTMQEIMDERFNKPEYNCYHKNHRNTCCLMRLRRIALCSRMMSLLICFLNPKNCNML